MAMDMIFVHKIPPNGVLYIDMTKYEGGFDNQRNESLHLENGTYIDAFKIKAGDNPEGVDTQDFIVRKIFASTKPKNARRRVTVRKS
jgi:hypothetical protein